MGKYTNFIDISWSRIKIKITKIHFFFFLLTVSFEKSDLKYVWKDDNYVLVKSPYLKTSNAYLQRNRTYECASTGSWRGNKRFIVISFAIEFLPMILFCRFWCLIVNVWLKYLYVSIGHFFPLLGNYSCLQVEMIFSRDRTFYFATIFIPGLILVTSSFITFFLEWDAVPARTIIGH